MHFDVQGLQGGVLKQVSVSQGIIIIRNVTEPLAEMSQRCPHRFEELVKGCKCHRALS
ncbi:uncharacterized protein B0H18DRAFT_1019884 [Fomitopsis serialis]|uniref:uncharacterized protein n=1 Tax=Fomitopsis serialis TaxID=139415 RepID=UPI002007C71D|nr:uncharacterized protein B0H18DRAFT_1019884 [Neoantrodia serialis]KAH9921749.1 hypothetical protein B0H18DRAFT_1019884 [Neoantrodia serialis]